MPALVENRTTNGFSEGVALDGPCTVSVPKDVVFDGASLAIEYSPDNSDWSFTGLVFKRPGVQRIDGVGEYYLRTNTYNAGESTDLTAHANQ